MMSLGQILCYALCYIVEGAAAWFYFEHLFARKKSGRFIAVFISGVYFVLFALFLFGEFLLNSVLFCLGNILILCRSYRCGKTAMVVHSAFMTVLMILTELAATVLLSYVLPMENMWLVRELPGAILAYGSVSKILYFLVLLLFARVYRPRGTRKEETYSVLLLSALPLSSIVVSVVIIYFSYTVEITPWVNFLMALSTVTLLAANFLVLAINKQLQKLAEERTELQLSMQKEQADAEYYRMVQQQYDSQRLLIHDLKNYLAVLKNLANEGKHADLLEYISGVETMPELRRVVRFCDNSILNAMLLWYSQRCEEQRIDFRCDIRKGCIIFDSAAITAFFGNLLSNAVEAAAQIEGGSIELSATKSHGDSVVVSVVNSCAEAPMVDDSGELISRKGKDGHGLGMKSIERVVKKYNGLSKMYYDAGERKFHSIFHFPVTE